MQVSPTFVSEEIAQSERPELTAAGVIISGGRGMQNGDNFSLLEGIADKLGAAIGASRAAVDAGFVPNDMQVDKPVKKLWRRKAPTLLLESPVRSSTWRALKDSKVIVAINKDEDAPIFQVADYGLVADLFQALPELESLIWPSRPKDCLNPEWVGAVNWANADKPRDRLGVVIHLIHHIQDQGE